MSESPTTQNLHIGRGHCLVAPFDDNGVRQGYVHLGNCKQGDLSTTFEKLTVQDYMTESSAPYDEIFIQTAASVAITGMEYSPTVLAMLLYGDVTEYTQPGTAVVDEELAPANVIKFGRFFFTAKRNIGSLTLECGGTPLVLDTDYKVFDQLGGAIQILEDAPNVTTAGILTASYTPEVLAAGAGLELIRGATKTNIKGSFRFLSRNVRGPKRDVYGFKSSINPEGGLGLISERDVSNWKMNITFLSDSDGQYGGSQENPFYQLTRRTAA
jgi:hypothetical protein